jgi:hypothetical protein
VRCATGGHDNGLRTEDVEITRTDVETDGPGNPVGIRLVRQQVGHHDPVVDFAGGLARGLGDYRLVAFAMNHDLPFAFALILPGFRVSHHRQAPLLEFVHRGVDMPRDIVAQVFAHQTHEVVPRVANMILRLVLVPLHAHVGIDRIQTLGDGAAAIDICLLDADNLEVAPPIPGFVGGSAASHAAADDEDIGIYEYRLSAREQAHQTTPCLILSAANEGRLSMLSASGSCASSWFLNASWLGVS